jgi:hypothetical protein
MFSRLMKRSMAALWPIGPHAVTVPRKGRRPP